VKSFDLLRINWKPRFSNEHNTSHVCIHTHTQSCYRSLSKILSDISSIEFKTRSVAHTSRYDTEYYLFNLNGGKNYTIFSDSEQQWYYRDNRATVWITIPCFLVNLKWALRNQPSNVWRNLTVRQSTKKAMKKALSDKKNYE